jgi:hypothetical protein
MRREATGGLGEGARPRLTLKLPFECFLNRSLGCDD